MSKKASGIENIDFLKNNDGDSVAEAPVETADAVTPDESVAPDEAVTPDEPETSNKEVASSDSSTVGYEKVIGVVTDDCEALNVRCEPNIECEVVGIIRSESETIIYEEESTEDFYKVCTSAGIEGYCMKQYITIK